MLLLLCAQSSIFGRRRLGLSELGYILTLYCQGEMPDTHINYLPPS